MLNKTPPFLVLGNPIEHSKSPIIHALFAEQTGISHLYDKALVPLDQFELFTRDFFNGPGLGANVTVPFKENAFKFVDLHTDNALAAGAVNTLIKTKNGQLLGENTDGAGLLCDLVDKDWIFPGARVLLLGAGGAAKGALLPILKYPAHVTVLNRTYEKALEMVERFSSSDYYKNDFGQLNAINYPELDKISTPFNLIINATASSLSRDVPLLASNTFDKDTVFYDMFYAKTETAFLAHYKALGCHKLADGLGMLVYQAALAFKVWHGVMPDAKQVLMLMKQQMNE